MKIEQDKIFKPVIITLETKDDYDNFISIIDEATDKNIKTYMSPEAESMAIEISDFATNNG